MRKSVVAGILFLSIAAQGGLVGILSTPADEGLISGGKTWVSEGEGLKVSWIVSQNGDGTWHYLYEFANAAGEMLQKQVNHFIFNISPHMSESEVFNPAPGVESLETGNFGPGSSNPGFPAATIYGLKVSLHEERTSAEFDSEGAPMWVDVYFKGGANPKNFAYNRDFGVGAVNMADYNGVPADAAGRPLFKIIAPNRMPEPASITILGCGVFAIGLRVGRKRRMGEL